MSVRWVAVGLTLCAALASVAAAGTAAPTYTVTFTGAGTVQHVDTQRNIQDSGLCDAAEHIAVSATLSWTTSWRNVRPGKAAGAAAAQIDGSAANGTDVKDACGLDLSQAPPGWVSQVNCSAALVPAGSPGLGVRRTATSLVLGLVAPPLAVPVGAGCTLNVRNDQLVSHVAVPLKKVSALKKGGSLTLPVGTSRPGPGDYYKPALDCSQATKPYEGYRTTDECQDNLSWSGTVKLTRAT